MYSYSMIRWFLIEILIWPVSVRFLWVLVQLLVFRVSRGLSWYHTHQPVIMTLRLYNRNIIKYRKYIFFLLKKYLHFWHNFFLVSFGKWITLKIQMFGDRERGCNMTLKKSKRILFYLVGGNHVHHLHLLWQCENGNKL